MHGANMKNVIFQFGIAPNNALTRQKYDTIAIQELSAFSTSKNESKVYPLVTTSIL